MKSQKIFYFYDDVKVLVKPQLQKTMYSFKLNEKEIFVVEMPLIDTFAAREVVNGYIEKLRMH